jgi:hypothetical protein
MRAHDKINICIRITIETAQIGSLASFSSSLNIESITAEHGTGGTLHEKSFLSDVDQCVLTDK